MTPIDLFALRRERRDGILAAGIGRSNGSSENLRRLLRLFWLIAAGVSLLVIAFLQLRPGQLWSDPRYTKPNSLLGRIIDGLLVRAFHVVNKCRPWHKIGKWPGVANLLALRIELRRYNLFDTDADLTQPKKDNGKVCPFATGPNATRKRNEDGSLNDLSYPAMGCRFTRLGRNMQTKVPIDEELDLKWPNPYEISEKLLQRTDFKPAMGLNLLAAAWIQFQVHDWFSHENEELTPNDSDPANEGKKIELQDENGVRRTILPKTKPDPTNWPDRNEWPPNGRRPPLNSRYPAYRNKDPNGGMPRRFMAKRLRKRFICAPIHRRAIWCLEGSFTSMRIFFCLLILKPDSPSAVSRTTGGSAWNCCTRCLLGSITASVTNSENTKIT
jgi:hypothetical protein